jgi:hypothetical protein
MARNCMSYFLWCDLEALMHVMDKVVEKGQWAIQCARTATLKLAFTQSLHEGSASMKLVPLM